MKCPKCRFDNRDKAKFCLKCGQALRLQCPQCDKILPVEAIFCDACGHRLRMDKNAEKLRAEAEGERKHVTVIFSDLSGYTSMNEKLDPEEVKEILSRIFGEIAQIIAKYEGFIERFIGDAVMALFGVPKTHEDDPVRAIMAAREIHATIDGLSPQLEKKVGRTLSMHTGIHTGLVVTGEVNLEKGTHGITGDTINLASRLQDLAKSGDILVSEETYRQSEGHFNFTPLEPAKVKGKEDPVRPYRVVSAKERPVTIHRLSGLRAELIGRTMELAQLENAVQNLRKGRGSVFFVCGDAGTGKSRLLEEFKGSLDLDEIQWLEGHSYGYSQNIPYFPLIDLLNRAFRIEEKDTSEAVRQKIESGIEHLVGRKEDLVPYIAGLYSLSYPEAKDVSPDFWKSRLQEATLTIISAFAKRAPTIFCLEDLHWADPSFVELLRKTLLEVRQPAIALCVYRPEFSLYTSHELAAMGRIYREIRLQDLSPSEAQHMLESLLKSKTIPSDLKRFVQGKTEGNPFYLEEMVNSLIEAETLVRDNGSWRLTMSIRESDISSAIYGVVSSRLDRLQEESKRMLQEASVIGRAFLYEIIRRITVVKQDIDGCLSSLERLDLIRTRSVHPELEYIFKHALTQEVVYNALLKRDRQEIHERIALVMETLFRDRLPEFYETLSFHFKKGRSSHKAVDYLVKSGEKSLNKYALEESHQYFREAYGILSQKERKTEEENAWLIDVLLKWALVFFYRGNFGELTDLLLAHKSLAESMENKSTLGMYYATLGFALRSREEFIDSHKYLQKALELGEDIQDSKVTGYACSQISLTCAELGLLKEAIFYGEKARALSGSFESDQYLHFMSLFGLGYAYSYKGDCKRTFEIGNELLEFGRINSNIRSVVLGYYITGYSHFMSGDISAAIERFGKGIEISADPYYAQIPRTMLGYSYVSMGEFEKAEEVLREVRTFSETLGAEIIGTAARGLLGMVLIGTGRLKGGIQILEEIRQTFSEKQRRYLCVAAENTLGRVYLQMVQWKGPKNLTKMAKNIGFLAGRLPFAAKKAEVHFKKAIEEAEEIGADGMLGQAYFNLGLLFKAKGRREQALECLSEAVRLFEACEATVYLKQVREALASF
jgi:class 3 adenylate cyclase/tetratricopeptide (TPR) repeat protein